jgi:hypothetical protein
MEKLATEIEVWLGRIEKEQPETEKTVIRDEIAAMESAAATAREQATALAKSLAGTPADTVPAVAPRARRLFAAFQSLLKQHKQAEAKLGIPVPPDPPPVDGH